MADNTPLTLQHARHLPRRTGFGASQADAKAFLDGHGTRGEAADDLLSFKPVGFKPGGSEFADIHDKWIKYMLKAIAVYLILTFYVSRIMKKTELLPCLVT